MKSTRALVRNISGQTVWFLQDSIRSFFSLYYYFLIPIQETEDQNSWFVLFADDIKLCDIKRERLKQTETLKYRGSKKGNFSC